MGARLSEPQREGPAAGARRITRRNSRYLQDAVARDLIPSGARCTPPGDIEMSAVSHGLFWMGVSNAVGVWLALLLLVPGLNAWAGEWTYGRWMPVHLNLHLYGWTSLPLLAWLFRLYRLDATRAGRHARGTVWVWSLALAVGAVSWLGGTSSGKVFLDWSGFSRVLLTVAMLVLWGVLAWGWIGGMSRLRGKVDRACIRSCVMFMVRTLGLLILLTVPFVWYWAAGPEVYPVVNPESGGPTGVSLLGSTLVVLLCLMLVPATLGQRRADRGPLMVWVGWCYVVFEIALYAVLDHAHASHRNLDQILGLGSLVPALVVMPLYYRCFHWPAGSRRWCGAGLFWIGLLALTGWLSFLPGVLDRLKFTNGLVAHSHLAMAGFITSFNALVACLALRGTRFESVLGSRWAFWCWQAATMVYLLSMWVSGWLESEQVAFTLVPNTGRTLIYGLRLACGLVMLSASVAWWVRGWRLQTAALKVRLQAQGVPARKPATSEDEEVAA